MSFTPNNQNTAFTHNNILTTTNLNSHPLSTKALNPNQPPFPFPFTLSPPPFSAYKPKLHFHPPPPREYGIRPAPGDTEADVGVMNAAYEGV